MQLTKQEAANMSDLTLLTVSDRLRGQLRDDWRKNSPGKLSDLYSLAVLMGEAAVRGLPFRLEVLDGQMTFDDALTAA